MMTKSMVESAWAEDMGQFLYHVDPNLRKITRKLEKNKIINNKQCSIIFNKTCLNNNLLPKYKLFKKKLYIYIYIYISYPCCKLNYINIWFFVSTIHFQNFNPFIWKLKMIWSLKMISGTNQLCYFIFQV